jgi:phage FluMu protein Com
MSNTKGKKTEYRCFNCNKKLAVGVAELLEIKCTRCGHVNQYQIHPERERPCETTSKGEERNPAVGLEAGR